MTQYEDDRLYCLRCDEQPDHFLQGMAEHVSRVSPEGALLEPEEEEHYVTEYRCPTCEGEAEWGYLRNRIARPSK
jgi:hypothetical protein